MEPEEQERIDQTASELIAFLQECPTPFHTVQAVSRRLAQVGFTELDPRRPWQLEQGGKYFVSIYDSSLIAFSIGSRGPIRITASHTDSPGLRIKPNSLCSEEELTYLGIQIYGGLSVPSWLDRPLSLAGKMVLQAEDPFHPDVHLFDWKQPVATIPSLAIHLNPKLNEGVKINPQTQFLPILSLEESWNDVRDKHDFSEYLLKKLGKEIPKEGFGIDSYACDIHLYNAEKGCTLGLQNEMLSAPRLDNLTSVKAEVDGLCSGSLSGEGLLVGAFFDNEEVGSQTKQGAASLVLRDTIARIYRLMGWGEDAMYEDVARGFMLSLDVAQGSHPGYAEKMEPSNAPYLGRGVVIKQNCSQAYVGDAEAIAIARALCQRYTEYGSQDYLNRNTIRGGSTFTAKATAILPIRAVDIGVPLLAMHSARELMAVYDQVDLTTLVQGFYQRNI